MDTLREERAAPAAGVSAPHGRFRAQRRPREAQDQGCSAASPRRGPGGASEGLKRWASVICRSATLCGANRPCSLRRRSASSRVPSTGQRSHGRPPCGEVPARPLGPLEGSSCPADRPPGPWDRPSCGTRTSGSSAREKHAQRQENCSRARGCGVPSGGRLTRERTI